MSWSLLLLSVLAADAVDAALQPLAGAPISGKLIAIADEKVTVERDGEATSLGFREVSELRLRDPHRLELDPKIIAELRDGSKLNLASYTVAKGVVTLGLMGGEQVIEIPARHVKHVQLQSGGQAANLQNEWREIKSKNHSGDVVVLKKKDNVLDYAEGVLYDVTPQHVQFEYDGRLIEVAASKVWGLIYYHPGNSEYPKPACRLVDLYETSWNVLELNAGDGMLHTQLVSGVKVDFPLQTISRLDFSSGNLVYLSELEI